MRSFIIQSCAVFFEKYLPLVVDVLSFQKAGSILNIDLDLTKRPHLHRISSPIFFLLSLSEAWEKRMKKMKNDMLEKLKM